MKTRSLLLRVFCLACCLGVSFAQPLSERFQLEAGLWFSTGDAEWTERGASGDGTFVDRYRSLLEYEDLDSPMLLLEAEVVVTPELRVVGRFGTGDMDDAQGADNDWIDGPGLRREFFVSRSENDLGGDASLWDIEVLYRLPSGNFQDLDLDVYASYGQSRDEFTSANGVQTVVDEIPVYEPFGGLASVYDFEWNSLTIGVHGEWQRDTSPWRVEGGLGIKPWVDFSGEAFWNLRTDFKRTPPNFVHDADGGLGFEGRIAFGYDWENLGLTLGYQFQTYEVDGGVSETFFSDGSSGFADLEASSTRHGVFGSVGIRF